MLLSKCSYDDAGPATPISSLATWMEPWNIYAMVMIRQYPVKAIELLAYQLIIFLASKSLLLHAWLKYDRKFRVLAGVNPTLRWDQRFSDYWLEAITARPLNPGRWPCPYCKSTVDYPENCPKSLFQDSRKPPERSNHRANDVETSNVEIVPGKHANINTFASPARGNIPFSLAQSVSSGEDHSPHTK